MSFFNLHLRVALGMRCALIMTIIWTIAGCSLFRPHESSSLVQAIVDANNQHAFGFLAIHNYVPDTTAGAGLTGGNEYAEDLTNETTFYALIECLPTQSTNAAEWFAFIEKRSLAGQLFLDASRKIAIATEGTTGLSGSAPCRIVNRRLATLPVIMKALGAPYEPARTPTADSYRLAQSFYLSMRGSYQPNQTQIEKLQLLPMVAMLTAYTGVYATNGDAFISDLLNLDSDFNPCQQNIKTSQLQGDPQIWKGQNFSCVPGPNGTYNYLPGSNGTSYETVRDMVGHEVDAIYDQQKVLSGVNFTAGTTESNRDLLFDEVTDTTSALNPNVIYGRSYGDNYSGSLVASNSALVGPLGLTGGITVSNGVIRFYWKGKWISITLRPTQPASASAHKAANAVTALSKSATSTSKTSATANKTGGSTSSSTIAWPSTNKTTTSSSSTSIPLPTTGSGSRSLSNATAVTNLQKNLTNLNQTSTFTAASSALGYPYLSATDQTLLQKVASGDSSMQAISTPTDSSYAGFADSAGDQVYVNKASGNAYVYKPAKVENTDGTVSNVTSWDNGPHAGQLDANGAMGNNYVGAYLAEQNGQNILGVHDGSKGNVNFQLQCTNGDCTVPCNQTNLSSFNQLKQDANTESDPTKKQALNDMATKIGQLNGNSCLKTSLALDGETDCSGSSDASGSTEDTSPTSEQTTDTSTSGQQTTNTSTNGQQTTDTTTNSATSTDSSSSDSQGADAASATDQNDQLKDEFLNDQSDMVTATEQDAQTITADTSTQDDSSQDTTVADNTNSSDDQSSLYLQSHPKMKTLKK